MEKEMAKVVPKIVTTWVYNHTMNRTWEIFKDLTKTDSIVSDLRPPIQFSKGHNTYDIGNEFIVKWMGGVLMFKCIELIEEDFYKKISWEVKPEEFPELGYKYIYHLYKNTVEASVVLVWEILLNNPEKFILTKNEEELATLLRQNLCQRWENFLKKSVIGLKQMESIIVSQQRERVWEVVSNWRKFQKIVPSLSDDVAFLEEESESNNEVGRLIELKWPTKKMKCNLKIIESDTSQQDCWKFCLECYEGIPIIPLQDIEFQLIELKGGKTFISFFHIFKEPLKLELINTISKDKKIMLLCLKKSLESPNFNDNSNINH
jgi:hypothetical protein